MVFNGEPKDIHLITEYFGCRVFISIIWSKLREFSVKLAVHFFQLVLGILFFQPISHCVPSTIFRSRSQDFLQKLFVGELK
jgi:hypothetical protein